jgi:hypothetical protein
VVAVATGTWLSGAVDGRPAGVSRDEAIGELDDVWTWVAESPVVVTWSEEPVVSSFVLRCRAPKPEARRASA